MKKHKRGRGILKNKQKDRKTDRKINKQTEVTYIWQIDNKKRLINLQGDKDTDRNEEKDQQLYFLLYIWQIHNKKRLINLGDKDTDRNEEEE